MCSKVDHPLLMPPPLPRKEKNKFPQKIETSTIWKKINICDVKKCDNNMGSRKKIVRGGGGGQDQKYPPKHTEKETHHMEKMASTWREMTAPT